MISDAVSAAFAKGLAQHKGEITPFAEWFLSTIPMDRPMGCVIDIGSHMGGTPLLWLMLGATQVISVDLPDGPWGGLSRESCEKRNASITWPGFVPILGDSHSDITTAQVSVAIRCPVDLLFIDGDHSFLGVKDDYERYSRYVRSGGVIAFHDIVNSKHHRDRGVDVARFWASLPGEKIEFCDGQIWGGIGAVRK